MILQDEKSELDKVNHSLNEAKGMKVGKKRKEKEFQKKRKAMQREVKAEVRRDQAANYKTWDQTEKAQWKKRTALSRKRNLKDVAYWNERRKVYSMGLKEVSTLFKAYKKSKLARLKQLQAQLKATKNAAPKLMKRKTPSGTSDAMKKSKRKK